jgi:uncharacterized membrane protein
MIALILPFATRVFGERFAKLASWAIVALLALLALWLAYLWAYDNGRDDERARWEAAAAKIEAADTKADAAATVKAAETKQEIDNANERAAAAASGSSDPLRDGLNSLRAEGRGKGD